MYFLPLSWTQQKHLDWSPHLLYEYNLTLHKSGLDGPFACVFAYSHLASLLKHSSSLPVYSVFTEAIQTHHLDYHSGLLANLPTWSLHFANSSPYLHPQKHTHTDRNTNSFVCCLNNSIPSHFTWLRSHIILRDCRDLRYPIFIMSYAIAFACFLYFSVCGLCAPINKSLYWLICSLFFVLFPMDFFLCIIQVVLIPL